MSFDIYVKDTWIVNITGNLGAFFAWALNGTDTEQPLERSDSRDAIFGKTHIDGLQTLDGMFAKDAMTLLQEAISRVQAADPAWLERFNAKNGWGTWPRGLEVLQQILNTCVETDPEATIEVSW